jgi:hypothetical protein
MNVVVRDGRRLAIIGLLMFAGAVAGCGGSSVATTPLATPTAPPYTPTAFTASSATALSSTTLASAIPLPTGNGFGGSLSFASPSNLPANAVLAETISGTAGSLGPAVPALSIDRIPASERRALATNAQLSVVMYLQLAASATLTFPNAPSFVITAPPAGLPNSAVFYLALYDPLRASLSWQLGFEGPATVNGGQLTFAAPSPANPFTLTAYVTDVLAVYAVSPNVAPPTPAPSTSAAPAPSPPAPFTLAQTSLALTAAGQTAATSIVDGSGYAGAYFATSSAPAVVTAAVSGTTLTITGVAAGTATITVNDAQARTATVTVQVTTTTLPIQ